jgi:excisionase family DNA binding protein
METRTPRVDDRLAYSIDEAARLLSISRRHLYDLISKGRLTSCKLGARRVITRSELERLLVTPE